MTASDGTTDRTTEEREIVISRTIDAPRELVFEAFTKVRHLSRWWGPDGFTTTTLAFEFREGGAWEFLMHAPDGSDYPNWITWNTIARPERITLTHGAAADDPDAFESILTFIDHGPSTEVVMRTVFPSGELRRQAIEDFHAIEGGRQTLGRLAIYVTSVYEQENHR